MRLGLCQIGQETDTFNPVPTSLRDFDAFGIYEGDEMVERLSGIGTVGGYLAATGERDADVETVPLVRGWATAGGRITTEAETFFRNRLRERLEAVGALDGLALQLHGACASQTRDDVEGDLLSMVREVIGDTPIVLTLDHHANLTTKMVELADIIVGYRTQPHDPFETAKASAELLLRLVSGEIRPVGAWRKLPLLSHQEQYLTSGGPMKTWFDRARKMEDLEDVLTVSNFPMQPWLDVAEGGWSTIVYTDENQELAERLVAELAELAWSMRDDFQVTTSIPPDEAVRRADTRPGLVVLSDTGDSVFGGAPGDSTVLLESMLRLGVEGRALVPMVDPGAAVRLHAAGEGTNVTLPVGGWASPFCEPVEISGVVRRVGEGLVEITDHNQNTIDMGKVAVVDVGAVTLLVSELRGVGGNHPAVYRHHGVEPADYGMAVLKTASNFQYFASLTTEVIRVDTPGPTQSAITALLWERVPRPIYPVDTDVPEPQG